MNHYGANEGSVEWYRTQNAHDYAEELVRTDKYIKEMEADKERLIR